MWISIPGGNSSFYISTPGSYYLTGDIIITNGTTDGIDIGCQQRDRESGGVFVVICTKSLPTVGTGISANYVPANATLDHLQ